MRYIKLQSILNNVPRTIRRETDDSTLLYYALEANRMINAPQNMEESIVILELVDHKAALPEDFRVINRVSYMYKDADDCSDDLCSLCADCSTCQDEAEEYETSTENLCRHRLNYQLVLDSDYYKNYYHPMKYVGTNVDLFCRECPHIFWSSNVETFMVNSHKVLTSSVQEGFICVDYMREMQDEDGDFLIVDTAKVRNALSLYAQAMAWLERSGANEQGAHQKYSDMITRAELAIRSARGQLFGRAVDDNTIREIYGPDNKNMKLLKTPFISMQKKF